MYPVKHAALLRGSPHTLLELPTRLTTVSRGVRGHHRSRQSGLTAWALRDCPIEETDAFSALGLLQKAGRVAAAAAIGLCLACGNVAEGRAEVLQEQILDPEIVTVRETLTEAWWKVRHIYYDTTYNSKDWNKVLEMSVDEVEHAPDPHAAYAIIHKMLAELGDHYTRVLPPNKTLSYKEDTAGIVVHVGIRLRILSDELLAVSYVAPGSAAENAGVQLGDTLISINGRSASAVPPGEFARLFRSDCDLRMRRESSNGPEDFEVHLQALPMEVYPVTYSVIKSPELGQIGYVRLTSFGEHTGRDAEQVMRLLESQGASAFIIDLRATPAALSVQGMIWRGVS
eukprot:jgi/Botrbrau1/4132/Bobra.0192s0007.1